MGHENILVDGKPTITLAELLRPGLSAVFVGLNPSPTSVAAGHYWQGAHGRTLWSRLQRFSILENVPVGEEDTHAFSLGFGFADLVRRPTKSAKDLTKREKREASAGLVERLKALGDRPVIVFYYKDPWEISVHRLQAEGFEVVKMPGPYESPEAGMKRLAAAIERKNLSMTASRSA